MATMTEKQCVDLYESAYRAGMEAGNNVDETPMLVEDSDPITGQIKPNGKRYVIPGICGFASVRIKPANVKFAKWLVKKRFAMKSNMGGIVFHVHEFNQSYERKTAFAYAFANVLYDAGLTKVFAESRVD
jgi:hypothetical protein